ncbi:MAG: hypothetical protein M5R40_15450 [Anaerolineae bacterium]|nr:hypothetical protein [Anaerolineae bacterium]
MSLILIVAPRAGRGLLAHLARVAEAVALQRLDLARLDAARDRRDVASHEVGHGVRAQAVHADDGDALQTGLPQLHQLYKRAQLARAHHGGDARAVLAHGEARHLRCAVHREHRRERVGVCEQVWVGDQRVRDAAVRHAQRREHRVDVVQREQRQEKARQRSLRIAVVHRDKFPDQ